MYIAILDVLSGLFACLINKVFCIFSYIVEDTPSVKLVSFFSLANTPNYFVGACFHLLKVHHLYLILYTLFKSLLIFHINSHYTIWYCIIRIQIFWFIIIKPLNHNYPFLNSNHHYKYHIQPYNHHTIYKLTQKMNSHTHIHLRISKHIHVSHDYVQGNILCVMIMSNVINFVFYVCRM